MKQIIIVIKTLMLFCLLLFTVSCASNQVKISPVVTTKTEVANWIYDGDDSITTCGASSTYDLTLNIDQNVKWVSNVTVKNTDTRNHRDEWNNRISVSFDEAEEAESILLFDKTIDARGVATYDNMGTWTYAAENFDLIKNKVAVVTHDCTGINLN